jgi:hypothetical protein
MSNRSLYAIYAVLVAGAALLLLGLLGAFTTVACVQGPYGSCIASYWYDLLAEIVGIVLVAVVVGYYFSKR